GLAIVAVVKKADQRREAERARHQHRFVMVLVGILTNRYEITHGRVKFLLSQPYLTREFVKVTDQSGEDFPQSRIFSACISLQHRVVNVLLFFENQAFLRGGGAPTPCHRFYVIGTAGAMHPLQGGPLYMSPSSRSSRRSFSGMAAAPGAALSRSRGESATA